MLKKIGMFLVKVFFKDSYLLSSWMDLRDTFTVVRYLSNLLYGTTLIPPFILSMLLDNVLKFYTEPTATPPPPTLCDLEIKVMDLEILC